MKIVQTFLIAELAWTTGIFLLILPVTILSADPQGAATYVRWFARALTLAAFPAGIAVAADVFSRPRPWRPLVATFAAASAVALLVFALFGFVVPPLAGDPALHRLLEAGATARSWEGRNHAAWAFYSTLFAPVSALLHAAIGIQIGAWAIHALPIALRRLLYWVVGLGLIVSGYSIFDSTYETVVLHTPVDVSFAAFYTLLIPAGICAGLLLPTIALARGAEIHGSIS